MTKIDKNTQEIIDSLQNIGTEILKDIDAKKDPELKILTRNLNNVYFDAKDKIIKLGDKSQKRNYFNLNQAKIFMQSLLISKQIKLLLEQDQPTLSIRQLFYTLKHNIPGTSENTFDSQDESDPLIEDVEVMTNKLREELRLIATPKGVISGPMTVQDSSGDILDFTKMGSGGGSIPPLVEDTHFNIKEMNADYILVVEKFAVWNLLNQTKYWQKNNCILMTGKGQPARSERRLLHRFSNEYKIPIYIFTDMDPWGYYIYSVYKQGSINLAYFSHKACAPRSHFLGFSTDDVKRFDMPKSSFIKMDKVDYKRLNEIKNYDWFQSKPWKKELNNMKNLGIKVEQDALVSKSIDFTAKTYLPEKIENNLFVD
jgi:DNA topoisomerase VI subunit A